jgi:hypothetical protein
MPMWAWALVLLIATTVIQMVLAPKAQGPEKASLKDFDFPQFEEGTPQAVFFGDCWTDGWMVLWFGRLRSKKIKQSGKK